MTRIAFYGLGNIGARIAACLGEAGADVAAHDPRPEAFDAVVHTGVRRAPSAAAAADGADVAIVVVRDDQQVESLLLGPEGVVARLAPRSIVVLHSTVSPGTVRAVLAACDAAGVRLVDVGVSNGGGRSPGTLYAMCGGDATTIDELRPVLDAYCADVVRFGDVGAGMKAKLVRNAMRYALWAVQYEGFALAEAAGLDLAAVAHLYRGTFGTSADDELVLQRTTVAPLDPTTDEATAAYVAAMTPMVTLGWKDLDDACELAHECGVELASASLARRRYGPALGLALRDEHDLTTDPTHGGTR